MSFIFFIFSRFLFSDSYNFILGGFSHHISRLFILYSHCFHFNLFFRSLITLIPLISAYFISRFLITFFPSLLAQCSPTSLTSHHFRSPSQTSSSPPIITVGETRLLTPRLTHRSTSLVLYENIPWRKWVSDPWKTVLKKQAEKNHNSLSLKPFHYSAPSFFLLPHQSGTII